MTEETPANEADAAAQNQDQPEDNLPANTVEVEEVGMLKKKVTVTVHRGRIDGKLDEMFGELSTSAQVPGFRIGRAPRRLIEKRFGKDVGDDVRNALVGESIGDALEEADLKTLGEPDLKLDEIELPDSGDMTFSFEVEVKPEFELPKTKGITVNKEAFDVDDEKIDHYIQNIREGQARYEKTDDPAGEGDSLLASAKIAGDGVEHENPRVQLRVAAGVVEGLPLVDLGKELAGKKIGDVVTLKTTAAESHPNEDWQGKELTIELTIHEVSRRILPEIDDAFATTAGFDSLEDFRKYIAENLKTRVESEIQRSLRKQICDYLVDNTEFDLPAGAVTRHAQRTLQRQMVELMQGGVPREKIQENQAELQAAAEKTATRDLKLSFILTKIAEQQEIEVSDDEINSRVAQIASLYNRRPERLRQELAADGTLQQVGVSVREDKAVDKLLEEASVVDVKPEKKKPEEKKQAKAKAKKKSAKKSSAKSDQKDTVSADKKKAAQAGTAKKKVAKKKTAKKNR